MKWLIILFSQILEALLEASESIQKWETQTFRCCKG